MPVKTPLKNGICVLSNVFSLIPNCPAFKGREIKLKLKREDLHVWAQTDTVKFVTLSFMFSRELKIWSFHIVHVVVHRQWRKWQKAQYACKTVAWLWKLAAFLPSRRGNLFWSLYIYIIRLYIERGQGQGIIPGYMYFSYFLYKLN